MPPLRRSGPRRRFSGSNRPSRSRRLAWSYSSYCLGDFRIKIGVAAIEQLPRGFPGSRVGQINIEPVAVARDTVAKDVDVRANLLKNNRVLPGTGIDGDLVLYALLNPDGDDGRAALERTASRLPGLLHSQLPPGRDTA